MTFKITDDKNLCTNQNVAYYDTKISTFRIGYTTEYITSVQFLSNGDIRGSSKPSYLSDKAITQINEYLDGTRKEFDLPVLLIGTSFQTKVWKALCDIPYGKTTTYKDIACSIGNPKAVRAVGMANNRNPIAIIIPCHRVIGSNGNLTGYAGGLDMKQRLLEIEGSLT